MLQKEQICASNLSHLVLILFLFIWSWKPHVLCTLKTSRLFGWVRVRIESIKNLKKQRVLLKLLSEFNVVFKFFDCGVTAKVFKTKLEFIEDLDILLIYLHHDLHLSKRHSHINFNIFRCVNLMLRYEVFRLVIKNLDEKFLVRPAI